MNERSSTIIKGCIAMKQKTYNSVNLVNPAKGPAGTTVNGLLSRFLELMCKVKDPHNSNHEMQKSGMTTISLIKPYKYSRVDAMKLENIGTEVKEQLYRVLSAAQETFISKKRRNIWSYTKIN
jgi:hypothetical protein